MQAERSPDDESLRDFAGYRLKRAWLEVQNGVTEILSEYDLKIVTFSALAIIVNNVNIRPSQLARLLAIKRSNLVGIIDYLEYRGLIERTPSKTDRRAQIISANPTGKKFCQKVMLAIAEYEQALLTDISAKEYSVLTGALTKMENTAKTLNKG